MTLQKAKVWKTASGSWGYVVPSAKVRGGMIGGRTATWTGAMRSVYWILAGQRGTA